MQKIKPTKKNVWQRAYGPQCLKYLLSSHLQKKFANPRCTLNRSLLFFFFLLVLGAPFPSPFCNNASWKNVFLTWNPPSSQAGDCLCLLAFFGAECSAWWRRGSEQLADSDEGAHWKRNLPNSLCNLCNPKVLKVFTTSGFACLATLLTKPSACGPAYFFSSGAA